MCNKLVSILIPVYNRSNYISDAVLCSMGQVYGNVEIIIADNCSTDGSWEKIKEFSRNNRNIVTIRNDVNIGPVRNWLKCLELSRGDFIKILWSDDWMDPTFVSRCINLMEGDDSVGFVYSAALIHRGKQTLKTFDRYVKTGLYPTTDFIRGSLVGTNFPASPGCALFRRRDVEKGLLEHLENPLGLEFASTGAGVDNFLFLRTASNYPLFGFVSDPLSHFRDHAGAISRSADLGLHYWWARKFFVDNFLIDASIRDAFYAKLWLANKKNHGKYDAFFSGQKVSLWSVFQLLGGNFLEKVIA